MSGAHLVGAPPATRRRPVPVGRLERHPGPDHADRLPSTPPHLSTPLPTT
ncbi:MULTISPECIES: hypothetical protein [Streptomyces]